MASSSNKTYSGFLPPPPGWTANIDRPSESLFTQIVLACSLPSFFALLLVTIRVYVAKRVVGKMFTDDWLIILALIFALIYCILNGFQTRNGMGYHIWDVTAAQVARFNTFGIPNGISYNLGTIFIKTSILSFYLRFAVSNRPFQILSYIMFFVVVLYCLPMLLVNLWLCRPVQKFVDRTIPGHCVDVMPPFVVQAAFNCGTDVVLLLMPIWLLWPLAIPRAQKIGLSLILAAGGFVCAVSFVRLAKIFEQPTYGDFTWSFTPNIIWCIIEMTVGIICACLPYIKFLLDHHYPGLFTVSPDIPVQGHEFSVFGAVSLQVRRWSRRLGLGAKRDLRENKHISMDDLEARSGETGEVGLHQRGGGGTKKNMDTEVGITSVGSERSG
ncbi:hypothetical protein V8F20_011787 [Naviculisporaceae sp. PSN 640]